MKQLFAVEVVETIQRKTTVYVRAGDRHDACDAAYDFARANDLGERLKPCSRELLAYESKPVPDYVGVAADVEV